MYNFFCYNEDLILILTIIINIKLKLKHYSNVYLKDLYKIHNFPFQDDIF